MSFYIEKLSVTGNGKRDSVIDFKKGLNIIHGASNTGKTLVAKCFDYMFGAEEEPFDKYFGYDCITLNVCTDYGKLSLSRKLGKNTININSNIEKIESGTYYVKSNYPDYYKTINYVWLYLIGIEEEHKINKNKDFKKQMLTLRIFLQLFYLNETNIIASKSVFYPDVLVNNTASISAFIFLLYGKDFSSEEEIENINTTKAKNEAIKGYVNSEKNFLLEKYNKLNEDLNECKEKNIEEDINEYLLSLHTYEDKIKSVIDENEEISKKIISNNNKLDEFNLLLKKYSDLNTQYDSDIKRLSFIIDGELNYDKEIETKCPFCKGNVKLKNNSKYFSSAKIEFKKISLQKKDLNQTISELKSEVKVLQLDVKTLKEKKEVLDKTLSSELKPQLENLKEKLSDYKRNIEIKKEISVLKQILEHKNSVVELKEKKEDTINYKAKNHLDDKFINDFGTLIYEILKYCGYKDLISVTFEKNDMDIVVNGRKKSFNGKGYNAFFNSITLFGLVNYMKKYAKYTPNFLLLDSPILSLKEADDGKVNKSMKAKLFEYFSKNQEGIQTIIIENTIPQINYTGVNLIEFTGEESKGRYGFFLDVTN